MAQRSQLRLENVVPTLDHIARILTHQISVDVKHAHHDPIWELPALKQSKSLSRQDGLNRCEVVPNRNSAVGQP